MIKYSHNPQDDELFKTINRTLAVDEQRLGSINKRFLLLQTLFNRQLLSFSSKQQSTVAIPTEDELKKQFNEAKREQAKLAANCR